MLVAPNRADLPNLRSKYSGTEATLEKYIIGNQPKRSSGSSIQSFKYVIVEESPYLKPTEEYFTKLYEPTVVAIQLIAMSHHENRWLPKKKSLVVFVNLAKSDPKPKIPMK
jgi:hypothetical protein